VPATRKRRKLAKMAERVPYWWHSIDLGDGVVTPGRHPADELDREWKALGLPHLGGKTVLDVGAWDGFFSFRAEEQGAARVVALDHYAWSTDLAALERYREQCWSHGTVPALPHTIPELWQPDQLPGKAGFDVAHRARESKVESMVGDLMAMDLDKLGRFDVVLALGLLEHLRHPLLALERLDQVTDELLVVETEAVAVPGYEHHGFCEFFEGTELNGDPTVWWASNRHALAAMCRVAGFTKVEGGDGPESMPPTADALHRYRLVLRAWK
jgi:tRNA (mo5U34)-methyltransferase